MSVISPELEMIGQPSRRSGKPKFLLRGPRRKQAKKCLDSVITIYRQDQRENARAETLNYNPFLITGDRNSTDDKAFKRVIARLRDALAAKS